MMFRNIGGGKGATMSSAQEIKPLHCGISVPDIRESIAWYQEMLGFTLETSEYVPPLKAKVAFLRLGDFSIELFEVEGAAPLPEERRTPDLDIRTHGTKRVAFAVRDVRGLVAGLKARNADIAKDVFPMHEDMVAFVRDNAGNLLEFIQRPEAR
jgi:methylmalonyl-CoA/ethylmalonyl-CoA epimerase